MEALRRGADKTFQWGDMSISVKPHASSQDRMDVAFSPANVSERFKLAARLMVTGWRGLLRNGQEVSYSPEELANVPDLPGRLFAFELGAFIWRETDISGRSDDALKNASALPSNGSSEQDPSTASAKTA